MLETLWADVAETVSTEGTPTAVLVRNDLRFIIRSFRREDMGRNVLHPGWYFQDMERRELTLPHSK
ncbi:MAG TPA: hypothetical protein PLZ55_16795, partial [bacterium]|nr:hypothetical protein [bacterium]